MFECYNLTQINSLKRNKMNKTKSSNSSLNDQKFLKTIESFYLADIEDKVLLQEFKQTDSIEYKFAVIIEVIYRIKGLKLFESQILTAYYLIKRNIVELPTGEGKTLAAVLAAIILAHNKHKIQVLVFNDYLAKRDYTDNKEIYSFFKLESNFIEETTQQSLKHKIYSSDIVYVSAKNAGFDYLRDFLAKDKNELIFPEFDVAIIDEADSILIDEARIPLVLAGNSDKDYSLEIKNINKIISDFDENDYVIDKNKNQVWLSDSGIAKIEKLSNINNLYDINNAKFMPTIDACMQANFILKKDKDYIVKDKKIQIIDESTGRVSINRKYPEILHKAVEVKEGLQNLDNSIIYNYIPIKSFINLYPFVCGMTGTAITSKEEFLEMYNLNVISISPHLPSIRNDLPLQVTATKQDNDEAVLNEIKKSYSYKRPVLIGTKSVAESERFEKLLKSNCIPCSILNAKNDEQEAEIISKAGTLGAVTISTNISGRGVDIKLGPNSKTERNNVIKSGGLYVLGTYLNRSVRVDNQLKGRAGRQGDPGQSLFIVNVDNDIIKKYYDDEEIAKLRKLVNLNTDFANKILRRAVLNAQKNIERQDIEARYMLNRYANIIEEKRQVVTEYRNNLLLGKIKPNIVKNASLDLYNEYLKKYKEGFIIAEKQILLYYININWAYYISSMEAVKEGIHFVLMGRKNPLDEYMAVANEAYNDMMADIKQNVLDKIAKAEITPNGIDMIKEGLTSATSTYTYLVDESKNQFNRSHELTSSVSHTINSFYFKMPFIIKKTKNILDSICNAAKPKTR